MTWRGIDIESLPLDRFCNIGWFWARKVLKPHELDRLESEATRPPVPVGQDPDEYTEGVWSGDSEMDMFNQLA